jgi:hypothetical protein
VTTREYKKIWLETNNLYCKMQYFLEITNDLETIKNVNYFNFCCVVICFIITLSLQCDCIISPIFLTLVKASTKLWICGTLWWHCLRFTLPPYTHGVIWNEDRLMMSRKWSERKWLWCNRSVIAAYFWENSHTRYTLWNAKLTTCRIVTGDIFIIR